MAIDTAERLTLLDPRAEARPRPTARVPRPLDLRGKRVGLLANGKPNSEEFLEALGALLRERDGAADVVAVRKPSASRVAPTEMLDALARECDVVVAAVGD
jgi:hypothetical protein